MKKKVVACKVGLRTIILSDNVIKKTLMKIALLWIELKTFRQIVPLCRLFRALVCYTLFRLQSWLRRNVTISRAIFERAAGVHWFIRRYHVKKFSLWKIIVIGKIYFYCLHLQNTVTCHIASHDSHLSTSANPLYFIQRLDYSTSGVLCIAKNKTTAALAGK